MSRGCASRPERGKRAFSLVELVLVVAILIVVAAIAAPRYGRATARYRAQAAALRIAADIDMARRSARSAGAGRTISFYVAANEYSIAGLPDLKDSSSDYRAVLSRSPYNAQVLSADFGGQAKLTFDGYGQAGSDGTVQVQVGDVLKTVVFIAASGKATVQ